MNEEEKFDELLSSKLAEREFPFNELNWDEAERLIIKQEKRRKSLRFLFVFSAGIIAGIALMLPFVFSNHAPIANAIVSTSLVVTKKPLTSSVASLAAEPKKNISDKSNNSRPVPIVANTSSTTNKPNTVHAVVAPAVRQAKSVPYQQQPSIATYKEPEATVQITNVNLLPVIINSIPSLIELPPIDTIYKVTVMPSEVSHALGENERQSQSISELEATNSKVPKTSSTDSVASKFKKDSTSIKDTNLHSLSTSTPLISVPFSRPINSVSIYAGGGYSMGWKDNGEREGNGLTPFGGLSFTHYFIRKISVSVGIGYSQINNLKNTYNSSSTQYDFGTNANIITITPQTIYYLVLPFSIQYGLNDKNRIGVGCDYLRMLTTDATVTEYQQNNFGETISTSKKEKGYTQGISNSDFQIILSYNRMLTSRFGINVEYYYGLVYIENSSFPNLNQYNKESGFRLVLSYLLIK